jgi:hypothetical protein
MFSFCSRSGTPYLPPPAAPRTLPLPQQVASSAGGDQLDGGAVVYRKGELSKGTVDREWPHQVPLPATRCSGHNYVTIRLFCEGFSLCRRGHSFRHRTEVPTQVARFKTLTSCVLRATAAKHSASSLIRRWRSLPSAGVASTSVFSTPATASNASAKTVRQFCSASIFAAVAAAAGWRTCTSPPLFEPFLHNPHLLRRLPAFLLGHFGSPNDGRSRRKVACHIGRIAAAL